MWFAIRTSFNVAFNQGRREDLCINGRIILKWMLQVRVQGGWEVTRWPQSETMGNLPRGRYAAGRQFRQPCRLTHPNLWETSLPPRIKPDLVATWFKKPMLLDGPYTGIVDSNLAWDMDNCPCLSALPCDDRNFAADWSPIQEPLQYVDKFHSLRN